MSLATLSLWGALIGAGCHPAVHEVPKVHIPAPPAISEAPGGIRFEEVAAERGLRYHWPQPPPHMTILESFGAGCAFLDYDNDGWMDVLLLGKDHVALFHNRGDGRFEDVSAAAGLADLKGWWTGCAVGDVDGDGYLDILLTGYRRLALLKNEGGRHFRDITLSAGLDPQNRGHWGSSAGFMDLDGSGRLALVIGNYVVFGPKEKQYCELIPGVQSGCPPRWYRPEFPELWRNLGNGKFKEITAEAGLKDTSGKAMDLAFADIDGKGRMDFYIGDDGMPCELMYNLGNLRFKNIGRSSGVAYGVMDHTMAAMGADWADYDRDGRPDLTVTAFPKESFALFRNQGGKSFQPMQDATTMSGSTLMQLGFGAKWIDVDNDGWPDIVYTCGSIEQVFVQLDPGTTFLQPLMLFHNEHGRAFRDLAPLMGGPITRPILGRGLATGDIDNDGRLDFLAVDFAGEPILMHNLSQTPNHWITLNLRGRAPNVFAYGAEIRARAGKQIWVGQVSPASAYLSSSDPRVHFGLGSIRKLDAVAIHWSDGATQTLQNVAADRILTITESSASASDASSSMRTLALSQVIRVKCSPLARP